jgi:hypothetical protein
MTPVVSVPALGGTGNCLHFDTESTTVTELHNVHGIQALCVCSSGLLPTDHH